MIGPHVFGDARLGCWIVSPSNLSSRLAPLRAYAAGAITDLFLPRSAGPEHFAAARAAGFTGVHLWVAVDGLGAEQLAARTLGDITRLGPGALELNIELGSDAALLPYMNACLSAIRPQRRNLRIRLNVAWRKGGFLPLERLAGDPHLFVCEQCYVDSPSASMLPTSSADALADLLDAGVPPAKAAVCYGAAGPVGGRTGQERVATLPAGAVPRRGVIFHDDLMAEAGLL